MPKPEPKNTRNLQPQYRSKYDALNQSRESDADMVDALATMDPQGLASAIARVIGGGDAIIISSTRAGGALCFTILEEDNRAKFYCATPRELATFVAGLLV